jgi:hypothetical protein
MDFDHQFFTWSSTFSQPPPITLSTSHCQSIDLATLYSDMTLTKGKEQLYWNNMAAPTAVKAKLDFKITCNNK